MTTTTTTTGQSRVMVMIEDRETMMTQDAQRKQAWGSRVRLMLGILLALTLLPAARAETITIGKGSGIVWEGLPFSVSFGAGIGEVGSLQSDTYRGLIAISDQQGMNDCGVTAQSLRSIGGYQAYPLAQGVGLIPRITATASYPLSNAYNYDREALTGTIGLPETTGQTSGIARGTLPARVNRPWCLDPIITTLGNNSAFYGGYRGASVVGTWVIVADGSQTVREVAINRWYVGMSSGNPAWRAIINILQTGTLRISNLACTVVTTTAINFGGVERNTTVGSELASLTYPLTVSCSQDTDRINANVNVQFRPISGLYNGNVRQLALNQGGGYITGEINNGVTGSGACNLNTGIPFDNTQLKVGAIASTETSKTFSNQVTWRLCSGGASLPTGPVTASADMLVTFN